MEQKKKKEQKQKDKRKTKKKKTESPILTQTKQRATNRATDAADILIQSFVTHLAKQQRKKEKKKKKKCFDVYVD